MSLRMSLAVSVAMSIAGCTSSQSVTYERGTLTRPPPAETRPGVGAPTYEPQVRPLPPQPQPKPTRVLPQTPETRRGPGVWAAEPPRAATLPPGVPHVYVLNRELPYPEDALGPDDYQPTQICGKKLNKIVKQSGFPDAAKKLRADEVSCLVARMYLGCLALEERTHIDPGMLAAFDKAKLRAASLHDASCPPVSKTPPVQDLVERMHANWTALFTQ